MKSSFILIFVTCCVWKSSAQRIENLQAAFDGQNLIVTYNLEAEYRFWLKGCWWLAPV
jgi:hypothetical protein